MQRGDQRSLIERRTGCEQSSRHDAHEQADVGGREVRRIERRLRLGGRGRRVPARRRARRPPPGCTSRRRCSVPNERETTGRTRARRRGDGANGAAVRWPAAPRRGRRGSRRWRRRSRTHRAQAFDPSPRSTPRATATLRDRGSAPTRCLRSRARRVACPWWPAQRSAACRNSAPVASGGATIAAFLPSSRPLSTRASSRAVSMPSVGASATNLPPEPVRSAFETSPPVTRIVRWSRTMHDAASGVAVATTIIGCNAEGGDGSRCPRSTSLAGRRGPRTGGHRCRRTAARSARTPRLPQLRSARPGHRLRRATRPPPAATAAAQRSPRPRRSGWRSANRTGRDG